MSTRFDRGGDIRDELQALIDGSSLVAKADVLVTSDAREIDTHPQADAGIIFVQPLPQVAFSAAGIARLSWQIALLSGVQNADPLATWERIDDLLETIRPFLPRPTPIAAPTDFPRDGGIVLPGYLIQFTEDIQG